MAKSRQVSWNHIVVELIEAGLESMENEKTRFFDCSDRLAETKDPHERNQIKKIVATMVFGQ
jgi:hypothetical protein